MSVSMTYRPHNPEHGKHFSNRSNLHKILEDTFGDFPITLCDSQIDILRGISACGYEDVDELVSAIHEFGKIKVEAE